MHNVDPTFAESAARWSQAGPASGLVITFLDTVNGCDRIFESGTGLVNQQLATTTCK